MRWQRPVYNRYTLYPPNHTSVLIHWRYQVALLKHLNSPDIDTYLNFGLDFMTDPDNLEVPSRRERKTLMVRSLLNVQPPSQNGMKQRQRMNPVLLPWTSVENQMSWRLVVVPRGR